jgi:hypothetical protein
MKVLHFVLLLLFSVLYIHTNSAAKIPSIWLPKSANASYVFLRPNISLASYFKSNAGISDTVVSKLKIKVSASQDIVPDDGKQRLLAAYRLFINSVEITQGPGRGTQSLQKPVATVGNAIYDSITVTSKDILGDGDTIAVALQCFQGNGEEDAWAQMEIEAFNTDEISFGVFQTNIKDWVGYNANAVFQQGVLDKCGRVNEDIRADIFSKNAKWKEASFIPSVQKGWTRVESRVPAAEPIAKQTKSLIVESGIEPLYVRHTDHLTYFFDFGYEQMSGIQLFVPGKGKDFDGFKVEIRLSEELNGTNTILYPETSGNKYISNCTLASNGEDSFVEHHEYPGLWRYGEIIFFPKNNSDVNDIEFTVKRWAVRYPFDDDDSRFKSSSGMLNQIWKLMSDSLQHTSLDTFTDSNTRERVSFCWYSFIFIFIMNRSTDVF